jgi:hypothetical protein
VSQFGADGRLWHICDMRSVSQVMKRAEFLSDLLVLLGVRQMLQNRCVAPRREGLPIATGLPLTLSPVELL